MKTSNYIFEKPLEHFKNKELSKIILSQKNALIEVFKKKKFHSESLNLMELMKKHWVSYFHILCLKLF